MKPTDFAYHLTNYLSKHLPGVEGCSPNTVKSYRDTFKLLLKFASEERGVKESKITLSTVNKEFVLGFLSWIEKARGCSASTRNQRLSAIHAFCSYLQSELPEHMYSLQQVMSIPMKKSAPKPLKFLSPEGVKALLAAPDTATKSGRKHMVILCLLYSTGGRVQEISDLTVADVLCNGNPLVKLIGKRQKVRIVPLDAPVIELLRCYIDDFGLAEPSKLNDNLFKNHSGGKMTRQGISHILKKYANMVRKERPELIPEKLSPHSLRHSRAIDMLKSGVELIYIRDILGHVSVQTTEVYARVDSEMKRKALEKASLNIVNHDTPSWQKDRSLMNWLNDLK